MAGKHSVRADLAYIYELDQFKSVKKHLEDKIQNYLYLMAQTDMTKPRSERDISFIQGQIKSLDWLLLEWKKIHKDYSVAQVKNKRS